MIEKIISGGQTGADFGGLLAGASLGIPTGGTAPKGWRTEKGRDPRLEGLGLVEDDSWKYPPRTKKNIADSDGTLAFLLMPSAGTERTIRHCIDKGWSRISALKKLEIGRHVNVKRECWYWDHGFKPVFVFTSSKFLKNDRNKAINLLKEFIERNNIKVLNVAGHRESSVPGLEKAVNRFLIESFS